MPNITQIPAPRVPVIDEKTGLMSREWYRFFINLFNLTGDGTNTISLTDLQVGPPPIETLPAGSSTQVQFNNGGSFGGSSNFTYVTGTNTLTVGNLVSANFTSAAQGLVPASGGGTSNFLRADGTFAAPPATAPAGSDTQIQFNNAGTFGGSANFTYNTGTNTFTVGPAGATTIIETLAPTGATVVGTLRIRGKNASATNGAGGPLNFFGGNALGTGTGGGLTFNSGTGTNGGDIRFVSGNGTSTGGTISFASGAGTNSSGGIFQMSAGNGNAGAASGGAFDLRAGNAVVSGVGGGFALQGGSSLGGGAGGDIQLISGFGVPSGNVFIGSDSNLACLTITEDGVGASQMGFFNVVPVAQPAAVPVTAAGIHAALVSLGLIT